MCRKLRVKISQKSATMCVTDDEVAWPIWSGEQLISVMLPLFTDYVLIFRLHTIKNQYNFFWDYNEIMFTQFRNFDHVVIKSSRWNQIKNRTDLQVHCIIVWWSLHTFRELIANLYDYIAVGLISEYRMHSRRNKLWL